MPDIRTYASEANARAAVEREGLPLDTVRVTTAPGDANRFTPVFTITEGAPGAAELVTRLEAEGFLYELVPAPTNGGANGDHSNDGAKTPPDNSGNEPGADQPTAAAGAGTEPAPVTDEESPTVLNRRSYINPHVSDLFFNYSHDKFQLIGMQDPAPDDFDEQRKAAIAEDAHEFAESVRYAFGAVLDIEELTVDFFERL